MEKENNAWKITEMINIYPSTYNNSDQNIEANLNMQGYNLLQKNKVKEAIKVVALNTELFPEGWNTY